MDHTVRSYRRHSVMRHIVSHANGTDEQRGFQTTELHYTTQSTEKENKYPPSSKKCIFTQFLNAQWSQHSLVISNDLAFALKAPYNNSLVSCDSKETGPLSTR